MKSNLLKEIAQTEMNHILGGSNKALQECYNSCMAPKNPSKSCKDICEFFVGEVKKI